MPRPLNILYIYLWKGVSETYFTLNTIPIALEKVEKIHHSNRISN